MTTKIARYLFGTENALTISTRTIDGQHWYAAVDICNLLGIANHSQAVHRERETDDLSLNDREWTTENMWNGKNKRRMLVVNDSGLLKLVLQGTSARAKEAQEKARQTSPSLTPAAWPPELLTADNA